MTRLIKLTLILLLFSSSAFSQSTEAIQKKLFSLSALNDIPVIKMPLVNNDSLLKIESNKKSERTAVKFGHVFNREIDLMKEGKKISNSDGSVFIILKIYSKGAYSINLKYNDFFLSNNASLFLFSEDGSMIDGPFDSSKNRTDRKLATGLIKGDCLVMGLYLPEGNSDGCSAKTSEVIHAFRNTFADEKAGDCYIDIICPIAAQWQNDKRAVARIVMGSYYCSGALVNNTLQNGKQYFLTANHCWEAYEDVSSWHFYFNYDAGTCGGFASSFDYVGNAVLLAKNAASDFCLVEIGETIPAAELPYFAGWANIDEPTDSVAVIHHPDGAAKKISFDYDMVITSTWGSPAGNHWRVTDYDTSSTEGGSSGAPLFNKHHRIIGQLHGGSALCDNNLEDEYGKFSLSWDYSSNAAYSLKPWLDPGNTGIELINGYDPVNPALSNDAQLFDILYPTDDYCLGNPQTPAVVIRNMGSSTLNNAVVGLKLDGGSTQYFEWDGSLAYNQKDTLFLDGVYLPEGNHEIKIWVALTGGLTDEFHYNDTINKSINGVNGQLVTLDIYGRKYYEDEIIWTLKNSLNQTIGSGDSYETPFPYVQLHISEEYCLTEDCYTFTIQDNNCGGATPGHFDLVNATTSEVLGTGCHTGGSQTYNFCIDICNPPYLNSVYDTLFLCEEEAGWLSADAFGENLQFQWFLNGSVLTGETNSTLDIPFPEEGQYSCSVWNECDSVNGLIALLQISIPSELEIFGESEITVPATVDYNTVCPDSYNIVWTITGGTILAGTNNDTVSVLWENPGTGTLTLQFTNQFGCAGPESVYNIILNDPVLIEEIADNNISIYSDIDNSMLIINQSGNEYFTIDIFSIDGRKINSNKTTDNITFIDMKNCRSGIYTVQLKSSRKTVIRKIFIG